MDISTFYGFTSATCFTLVGLWWSVVQSKPEWKTDEAKKRLAGGVYASFLIPGLGIMGAAVSGFLSPFAGWFFLIFCYARFFKTGEFPFPEKTRAD